MWVTFYYKCHCLCCWHKVNDKDIEHYFPLHLLLKWIRFFFLIFPDTICCLLHKHKLPLLSRIKPTRRDSSWQTAFLSSAECFNIPAWLLLKRSYRRSRQPGTTGSQNQMPPSFISCQQPVPFLLFHPVSVLLPNLIRRPHKPPEQDIVSR